jgi:hypothetical protein
MLPASYRVERVQRTLQHFEEDIPLLDMRFKDLSAERQNSARKFAAALIDHTRSELNRLMKEVPAPAGDGDAAPRKPADRA